MLGQWSKPPGFRIESNTYDDEEDDDDEEDF